MRSEEEAYQQLRKWGYGRRVARSISKGLYAWVNKPELNDKGEK